MKHKVKRISKSSLSVVLSLCMLFSCFTAAFVATDAATVDSASTGDDSYTLWLAPASGSSWTSHPMTYDSSDSHYHCEVNFTDRTVDSEYEFTVDYNGTTYRGDNAVQQDSGSYLNFGTGNANARVKVKRLCKCDVEAYKSGDQIYIKFTSVDISGQTWTVVGDRADLFGNTWAPTATSNDMTYDGSTGTYKKEYENYVPNTTGAFQYKIARDHAWNETVPSGNKTSPSLTSGLHYKVVFTYDGSDVTCDVIEYCQLEAYITNDYTLRVSGTKNITNISGSNTDYYLKGSTATVKVIPADNTKKVTAISAGNNTVSTPTQMSSGAYKATFTVNYSATGAKAVSATLANKQNVTVNFSGTNGTVTAVTEDGTTLTSGQTVLE